ncbi:MAG: hypothetical protein WCD11_24910 [Solirubrobacteraceae bacterium]
MEGTGGTRFAHTGVVVDDLASPVGFFALLGLECSEPFAVHDMSAVVDRLRAAGCDTVGEIVDYQGMCLLCYVRGPEWLIIELAERLRPAST